MSKYVAKAALRQAKNYTKGYTDIQIKVREATSNDPWGPSGSQMAEIAEATYRAHEFMEIMDIIDKRLNDSGKNWRHVFKALTLLDYLIHSGSEQVIAYAKQNLYVIKTLKEFQFIDEEGKDQGLNVREKSKNIAALLADDDRLKEERQTRANLREKMSKGSSIQGGAGNYGGGGGDIYSPATPNRRVSYAPSTQYEEDHQLERAIQESKRAAEEQERRTRDLERHERELTVAIESSRADNSSSYQSPFQPPQQQAQQQKQEVDLWGGGDQRNHDLDFFSSMAVPAPVSAASADPFGLGTSAAAVNSSQPNFFGGGADFGQTNAFGAPQPQANPFGAQQAAFPPQQQQAFGMQAPQQQQQQQQLQFSSQPVGGGATFDSAFDTGAGQKNLVPRHLQGQSNPNAQLAHIARNAAQIDPFANMAGSGGMNPLQKGAGSAKNSMTDLSGGGFGQQQIARPMQPMPVSSGSSAFGQPSQMQMQPFQSQQQQQQQASSVFPPQMGGNAPTVGAGAGGFSQQPSKQGGNDPFASLAPFPQKNPNTPQQQQQQQQMVATRPQQQPQQSMGMMSQPGSMMASGPGGMGMGMMAPMSSSAMMPQGMGMNNNNNNNPFGQQQQRPFQPQQQQQGFGQPQQQNSFFF